MPTGYTADVATGKVKEFKEYALSCARAFGALISMRDDPLDKPIPDSFEEDTYYAEKAKDSKEKLKELKAMTKKQRVAFIKDMIKRNTEEAEDSLKRVLEENNRYKEMKSEAEKYVPPTSEHENFKKFMISQLEDSMNTTTYYTDIINSSKEKVDYEKEFDDWLKDTERDIAYYQKKQKEEEERTKQRNDWIKALKESLK